MMTFRNAFIAICVFSLTLSCSKEEGEGGTATISGKLLQVNLDENLDSIGYEYLLDEDVFISYGENTAIDDDTKTGIDGTFEFKYLFAGDYTVFATGEDSTGADIFYTKDVTIDKEDKDIGNLITYNIVDYNDGNASISGTIFHVNYFKGSNIVKDTSLSQYDEVFLVYNGHDTYDARERTNYNGKFTFDNLITGDYTVYVYSEDLNQGTQHNIVSQNITITEENEVVEITDIYVIRF